MALVIGHSQAKYLSDYLSSEQYSVFSYSGYRTLKFLQEDVLFDVAPFFSVVVIVVGANDIGVKSPETIADDIECLCDAIHGTSPSATVFVSTVLPRCQNRFQGCAMPESYISHWNDDACDVNNRLRAIAYEHDDWIRVIEHPQFYTFFGSNKRLLSKDGLHLSYEGTDVLADDIVQAVQQLKVVATTETSLPHVESTRSAVQQLEVVATTASVPAVIHVEQDSPSVLGPRLYSEIVSNGSTTETSLPHVDSTRSGTSRASTRSTTTETSRRHVDSTRSGTSRASTRSTTTETSRRHVDSTRSGTKTLSNRRKTSVVEIYIENNCICNLPACVDTVMVECDKCATWYHKSCIDAPIDISTNEKDFTCGLC